jgi:hypothetical protein
MIENALLMRAKPRKLRVEPRFTWPYTLNWSERMKLRTDVAEPTCVKSSTDKDEPSFAKPYRLKLLPQFW